jgi:hypothetical protein
LGGIDVLIENIFIMEDIFIPIISLVVGAGFIYLAIHQKEKRKMLLQNGVETDGVINGFATSIGTNNMTTSYPIIRFQTKTGKLIEQKANVAPPKFLLKDGQSVIVTYNPDNPEEYIFKTSLDFSKILYVFLIGGIGLVLFGLWATYKYLIS